MTEFTAFGDERIDGDLSRILSVPEGWVPTRPRSARRGRPAATFAAAALVSAILVAPWAFSPNRMAPFAPGARISPVEVERLEGSTASSLPSQSSHRLFSAVISPTSSAPHVGSSNPGQGWLAAPMQAWGRTAQPAWASQQLAPFGGQAGLGWLGQAQRPGVEGGAASAILDPAIRFWSSFISAGGARGSPSPDGGSEEEVASPDQTIASANPKLAGQSDLGKQVNRTRTPPLAGRQGRIETPEAETRQAFPRPARPGSPSDGRAHFENARRMAALEGQDATSRQSTSQAANGLAGSARDSAVAGRAAAEEAKSNGRGIRDVAVAARGNASAARDEASAARETAVSARGNASSARDQAVAARSQASAARDTAVAARSNASTARDQAVAARGQASAAREAAMAARDNAKAARNQASAAREQAKNARANAQAAAAQARAARDAAAAARGQ